jgi:hypothetical protein
MENEEKLGKLSNPLRKAFEEIIKRCKKAGIDYEWRPGFDERYGLSVCIQQGTGKHKIILFDAEDGKKLLDSDFEKYVFVEGYREAICYYEEGYVEAVVESIGPVDSKTMILSFVTGRSYKDVANRIKAGIDTRLELDKGGDRGVKVSIGNPSKTLLAMLNYVREAEALSVRVERLRITKNTEAAEQLGRVTDSLFFELRKKCNVDLFVRRHYEVGEYAWKMEWRARSRRESEVGFPKFEYDKKPIELYWHAVSAYKMPLLQYLAYYQILEYYFTKYSMLGAKKEIRNCLKDPEFNVDDEDDIVKIVTCVSGKLGRYVSENELLCDTIRECVSEEELVPVVSGEAVKEYFKKDYKIVSQFRVSQENKERDIREQLAERIYDIRCRIVHTKEDDKRGRVMPFTKEEVLLQEFDLPMIETLVDKVIIANSKKLSFR